MIIYIVKNGARQGPYSIEQVVELIRKGKYSMSDLTWREGMTGWQPIHSLADIVEAVLPPYPTPLKDQPGQSIPPTVTIPPPPLPLQPMTIEGQKPPSTVLPLKKSSGPTVVSPTFLYIPKSRFIVMCIISLGWFQCFWIYRNWKYLKERDRLAVNAFWRGIFGLFYIHSLFKAIKTDAQANQKVKATFSPDNLVVAWIFFSAIGVILIVYPGAGKIEQLLGILVFIFTFWFILPVQDYIITLNESLLARPSFCGWSAGQTVCLILGVIGWLQILIGLFN
jgi:hypothetical protein